ncbi:hypothetical protein Tco_0214369 [Tanacetum coccineum]
MEPYIENMTLNEYLMYQGRHRDLERSCTSRNRIACSRVAPVKYRNLVYPDSDEEDEEYCRLPPLPLCFQTRQPCIKFNSISHNVKNEVDIDSMTLDEYDLYMAMQCLIKSEIQDSSLDEILDDLIRIGAENIRRTKHEVPNRCDDKTVGNTDYEDGELPDFPTFSVTNIFASVCE